MRLIYDLFSLLKSIIETILFIIRLLAERFLKTWSILFFVFIYALFINWNNIILTFTNFRTPEYILIKDYLALLLSLPVAIFIISIIFFYKFSEAIKTFLQNSRLTGLGGATIDRAQTQPTTTEENIDINEQRAEYYEFSYLNLFLVQNSKNALIWFYSQPNHSSTKNNFMNSYQLEGNFPNPQVEKETILNVLIQADLISRQDESFLISRKGEKFLRALGQGNT